MTPEDKKATVKQVVSGTQAAEIMTQRVEETWKLDPEVVIHLKGKEYTLEFTNFAVKEIAKHLQIDLLKSGIPQGSLQDSEILTGLIYYGLQEHHPEITKDQIDRMLSLRHYGYILNRLTEALSLFSPDMSDISIQEEGDQKVNGVERPM